LYTKNYCAYDIIENVEIILGGDSMIYDLNISNKQADYIRERKSDFCVTTDEIINKIKINDFVRINSANEKDPKMIAIFYDAECFYCIDDFINSHMYKTRYLKDEIMDTILIDTKNLFLQNHCVYVVTLNKTYSNIGPIGNIPLYVITRFMYYSIMFFRHLPLTKKLFKYKIEKSVEERLFSEIKSIESLIAILSDKNDFKNRLQQIGADYKEKHYDYEEILSLLDLIEVYSINDFEINDMRAKLIMEIENQLKEIINAYENKNYLKIRDIGYAIHNVPIMIIEMHDWS